jgi:hypothetical protein
MAYTGSGQLIEAWDYNRLTWGGNTTGTYTSTPSNFAYVWGVGNGQFGYGQDVSQISAVTSGTAVSATQWSQFIYALNKCLGHQSGSAGQLANGSNIGVTAGATIAYFANVATAVSTVNTNAALYTAQGSTTTGSGINTVVSSTGGLATWQTVDRTVTFASAQHARYFFNAGGQLNYRVTFSGGNGSGSTNSLQRVLTGVGGTNFLNTTNSGRTGSGIQLDTNATNIGYRNLTTSPQNIVFVTDNTASYTGSNGVLQVYCGATDTTNGAVSAVVVFRLLYDVDDKTWDDTISLTVTTKVDIVFPETTYLTATAPWGTPTVS